MVTRKEDELLEVNDLNVTFFSGSSVVQAVEGVSFGIRKGEVFGLVGESGSGKTVTALSILNLVPPPGRIVGGTVLFEGRDLGGLTKKDMEKGRGGQIGMIFQEPMSALNPVFNIGGQIAEVLSLHTSLNRKDVKAQALQLLQHVGFKEPTKKYIQYPHQLSGGQRQRVLIAMAIACNPSLLIADEPTTALDVATEGQILALLRGFVSEHRMSMLFITHNLHTVQRLAKRVGIMYAGRLMELTDVDDFFERPLHPYSRGLLDSVVWLKASERKLVAIPGSVPRLFELPKGCKFHPRCSKVMPRCMDKEPPIVSIGESKWVRCYLYQD